MYAQDMAPKSVLKQLLWSTGNNNKEWVWGQLLRHPTRDKVLSITETQGHRLGGVVEVLGWRRSGTLSGGGPGALCLGAGSYRFAGGLGRSCAPRASQTSQKLALADALQVQVSVVVLTGEVLELQLARRKDREAKDMKSKYKDSHAESHHAWVDSCSRPSAVWLRGG